MASPYRKGSRLNAFRSSDDPISEYIQEGLASYTAIPPPSVSFVSEKKSPVIPEIPSITTPSVAAPLWDLNNKNTTFDVPRMDAYNALEREYGEYGPSVGPNSAVPTGAEGGGFSMGKLFGDEHTMGNITGLAGTLMQAAALPGLMKNARLQNKALSQNIATARLEQDRRNNNIASFNNRKTPTSAFV